MVGRVWSLGDLKEKPQKLGNEIIGYRRPIIKYSFKYKVYLLYTHSSRNLLKYV